MHRRLLTGLILMTTCALTASGVLYAQDGQEAGAVAQAATPEITLIDAGNGPKQELRFTFKVGDEQKISMAMKMNMSQTMNGSPAGPPMDMPVITFPVTSRILSINDDGAAYEMIIGAPEIADDSTPMASMMFDSMKKLEGMKITGVIDDRGHQSDVEVDAGDNTDPGVSGQLESIRNSLTQMTPPLPEQAIGAGAKWSYKVEAEASSVTATNTTTVTLQHRDGNALALEMIIDVSADPQAINSPDMPPAAKAELLSMAGTGTGHSTVLLTRLFPISMEGNTKIDIEMSVDMGAGPMKMGQNVEMKLNIEDVTDNE